jgi:hypothetical protein
MAAAKAFKSTAANALRFAVAVLPLYPAIRINLDASAGQGETWAAVGIGFVLFGALAIEHSLRAGRWHKAALWGTLGATFLCLNAMNAIANLATHTDRARADSQARMDLTERRKEHARLAGEATPDSIAAEIKAAQAASSRLWQASQGCDPNQITRDATRAFCKSVADLEARKAAATKRDAIDIMLATAAPMDSFADAMADGLSVLGYQIDEKAKLAITRSRDWSKAIGVELLAMFGPAALLGLLGCYNPKLQLKTATISDDKRRKPDSSVDGDIDAFYSAKLKAAHGLAVSAGALFKTWQSWCEEAGVEPGTQRAFSARIQKRLQREPNHGRPRYLNVALKEASHSPGLRLAVSNA